jgi:hypothetical protein
MPLPLPSDVPIEITHLLPGAGALEGPPRSATEMSREKELLPTIRDLSGDRQPLAKQSGIPGLPAGS